MSVFHTFQCDICDFRLNEVDEKGMSTFTLYDDKDNRCKLHVCAACGMLPIPNVFKRMWMKFSLGGKRR